MGRKPYLPTFAKFNYSIGASQWKLTPDFPEIVGKCIGMWTFADNEMGTLFGVLLGTESPATLEVFLSLRRASSQREAMQAAAKHAISDARELQVFEALMVLYKSLEAQRNDLAHGCFGTCPSDASILYWIDMKDYVHFLADMVPKLYKGSHPEDVHAMLKKNLFVYKMPDLKTLLDEMDQFQAIAAQFSSYLRRLSAPRGAQVFEKLYNEPLIQRTIFR